ncbi:MAG: PSD1 domain-containing protein [Verrucomicrobia bacterium]|nr:PSD1 domain-containing protein [Verrucomicrobiota bacterium]
MPRRIALAAFCLLVACTSAAPAPNSDDLAFFESKVRPLLADRCYECHGARKQKSGLRLDSLPGWQAGGDGGDVIRPGDPARSRLIEAVRYTNEDLQMPPKESLRPDEVAVLVEWVKRGAPDPRTTAPTDSPPKIAAMSLEQAREHWAFRPVIAPPVPAGVHPIDHLVRTRLAAEKLAPNPPADPRTLIRRAYLTLLGLPPSYDRVEQFAAAPSPAAFAQLIDQLLARPEYGQRWGRHWLDAARYSDTTEKSTDSERRIPFAHTYRDYVIESFNTDRPFDRFIREQIAADLLPSDSAPDLRALGFLTVGRRFEGNIEAPQLIVDERIDTIGRGVLGLTLSCARCHDHKFDAVPTSDYYSLYGILASTQEPLDLPEIGRAPETPAVKKYRADRAALLADYDKLLDDITARSRKLVLELAPEYLRHLVAESPNHRTVEGFVPLDTPRGLLVLGGAPAWANLIDQSNRRGEAYFKLWPRLLALPSRDFAVRAKSILDDAVQHATEHDPQILAALAEKPPASMLEVADAFGRVVAEAAKTPEAPGLSAVLCGPGSFPEFNRAAVAVDVFRFVTEHQLVARKDGEAAAKIREKLTTLEATAPVDRAQFIGASTEPFAARVMLRGDRNKLGDAVPRRFPQVLAAVDATTYSDDGRRQLAAALASPQNPLTARVIVNRVWQQHFGTGLVATADNFGASGERPSHPELLDHLAAWFMAHGWSIKALHRHVMSSATWQQSSALRPDAFERDPANRLLWRMSPHRLDFETMRDSLLRVAGRLDVRLGGRSAALDDDNVRRAVYGYTDRYRIPALLRNFDMANPDQSIARRAETTHPLQALFFLNSPFVRTQAEHVNRQPEIAEQLDADERVRALYRRVLLRGPDRDELTLARRFLGTAPAESHWVQFTQALLLSNEFFFCD